MAENITQHPSAPAGWGVSSTGHFAKVTSSGTSSGGSTSSGGGGGGSTSSSSGSGWVDPATGQATAYGVGEPATEYAKRTGSTSGGTTSTSIPFKSGLSTTQQQSITNLTQKSTWNSTDIANWNYATNNAPLPTGVSVSGTSGTTSTYSAPFSSSLTLTDAQKSSINNLVNTKPVSQWTSTDIKNWNYATGNAPLPSGSTAQSAAITTEPIVQQENDQLKQLQEQLLQTQQQLLQIKQPQYEQYKDYTQDIQQSREKYNQLYEGLKATTEEDFRLQRLAQISANRVMMGKATRSLARMGALGNTGSGIDYLKQVDVYNQQKLGELLVQKQKILLATTEAQTNKDYQLLEALVKENTRVTDQINKIRLQTYEDTLKTNDQLMEQAKFGWASEDRAMKKMSDLANMDISSDQIPAETKARLEREAGVPVGTFDYIFSAAKETNDIKRQEDLFKALSSIPANQKVEINGKMYTGLKKLDLNTYHNIVEDTKTGYKYSVVTTVNADGTVSTTETKLGVTGKGLAGNYTEAQLVQMGGTVATAFRDGTWGGQCGEFVHNIVASYPYGLNTIEEKMSQIDPAIGTSEGQSQPQVGDVVIQTAPATKAAEYGHVSVINAYDPATGIMTLTESNYYGNEQISTTRTLNANDATVEGFYRGQLRPQFVPENAPTEAQDVGTTVTSFNTKEQKEFEKQSTDWIEKLAQGKTSWGAAYDALYTIWKDQLEGAAKELGITPAQGQSAGQALLDQVLNKDKFYNQSSSTGGRIQL